MVVGTGQDEGTHWVAAENNADWCDAVCRGPGLDVHRDPRMWWTATRSPDLYPDAVTLDAGLTPDEVLSRLDGSPGCSVKDSFATLDLASDGAGVLAGPALNRSDTAVGLSNLFCSQADPGTVRTDAAALAGRTFPGLPLVGYESGPGLEIAIRSGYAPGRCGSGSARSDDRSRS